MLKFRSSLLLLLMTQQLFANWNEPKKSDTLSGRSYDYLFDKIELTAGSERQQIYLSSFLRKAKTEKNDEEILNGYKNYVHYCDGKLKLVYADSMIYAAKKADKDALIGSAYLSKGIVFYSLKNYKSALDHYLIADNFISKTDDDYLVYKVKYNIAQIKYYLGFYDEAVPLLKQCIEYFSGKNARAYLNSLHSLGLCYGRMGNYGLASQTNAEGLKEGERLSNDEMKYYFIHSEGVNQYFKSNYADAVKSINASIPMLLKNRDFANEAVAYFYLGRSYWDLHKPERAVPYFMKVDRIFENKNYIRPDLRQNYELLIKYYKGKQDLNKELFYIKKLLKADSVLSSRYVYLSGRIRKVYDTKVLIEDKQKIEKLFNNRKYNDYIYSGVIVVLFSAVIFFAHRHSSNKKTYRLKFEQAINGRKASVQKTQRENGASGIEDISSETVAQILRKLEKFESDKKFLLKDLNAAKLASITNSNPKYLSAIIRHHKGKKFVNYISDLKIEHIIALLKEDKKIRKYSNKALAEEGGFSSTRKFSQAFFAKTGCPTSFFIDEINKMSE
ncbi:AraC family transcriptional regulator [Flavobacterium endoglycinae]|uniref:AraC family transcriptional regulator n=1 Tax=Flavobacterium endoglycinae TaxID=2816357 RepID=A0ABX7QGW2_9FLAO|nr:AraC family transcriptional regulator [Flavobacterium endoglycinae]QSW89604.1 AraC family transcriptional regulator [Flavobacterium endoglycinae]